MKPIYPNWPIYVGWSKRLNCRGILSARAIKKGEIVEVVPVVLVEYKTRKDAREKTPTHSLLDNYYYDWNSNFWCLALGYGSLYNHSYHPNLAYKHDYINKLIKYVAIQDINQDEELTVNYNYEPDDKTPIDGWFRENSGRKIV